MQYYAGDQRRVTLIEDRLKQWHAQLGDNSKTQIRSLSRFVNDRNRRKKKDFQNHFLSLY